MTAVATASIKSPSHSHTQAKSHSHSHSHSRSSRPSTTPRAQPAVASVGQSLPPQLLSPKGHPPHHVKDPKSPSPSYFGFVVGGDVSIPPDSNPGAHTRQNWTFTNSNAASGAPTPRHLPVEANPDFEAFRRQSEHNHRFALNTAFSRPTQSRNNSTSTPRTEIASPLTKNSDRDRQSVSEDGPTTQGTKTGEASFFDLPRQQSPVAFPAFHSVADHQHARLSLPGNGLRTPPFNTSKQTSRSETLPSSGQKDAPPLMSPAHIAGILTKDSNLVLVLDLRVYQQYATARIQGALNLCIPTTLLKRPAYNVQRLAETFASARDQEVFARWRECTHIVVYDANSNLAKEAVTPLNALKKFTTEGWTGTGLVVKGGFLAFQKQAADLVDSGPVQSGAGSTTQPLSISATTKDAVPVAGGCAMPTTQSAANPFFGNIRQNMDLLDGVGQMPIKRPINMSSEAESTLPAWLKRASSKSNDGKLVSDQFLNIEKSEQKRMQDALSVQVSYGTPKSEKPSKIEVAGIEKGSKNRYNNIFPYDHTRVRLQDVPNGSCDYINASHVKAEYSNRHYIATQAPIPATFNDFWRVVWEQDVRVIVMLTAEAEGGQVKSHVYWNAGGYGPLKLKQLSERRVSLESKSSAPRTPASSRPSLGPRRSTTANIPIHEDAKSPTSKPPSAVVRHFSLSHAAHPFQPMREITQVQYEDWPDFGAPASPMELLGLVEQVNKYIRGSASPSSVVAPDEAAPAGSRPIVVHCSAGCGRTGTFCTIDSVIDMLKKQRISHEGGDDKMDVDGGDWVDRDDVDLVAKTVDDFRRQRLSMVQNLRQFVLCYESILQWLVQQEGSGFERGQKRPALHDPRRSYG
ncbi:phosphotyrosine-specific ptp2-like protein [Exophiala xenobiotica]|uniref:protein-tyrosine-phosphatase n=1 Tax=Vermiconidia calcicola TaxID=1690605 RepID=A0AAV9PX72_9PEZI|nr:phosphotyrosine-specific ptp2-like protein [Exophiala xenobiotica]KAK5530064.1 phosphotyrosine-specific ptp2-like protein [Vermiconidia calcicola]KAK5547384.1 phosphotyrosine-specific ptp2-like protein [Chaetothyriales sp. CCFEE 6169]KAK5231559.1 phosphotyrosine-specific ptp2-like protein [Exophiala xenobiotica]KAK5288437.1 phosphotyrosine-specific ptp2-like protein [Exophiala xenobiotica]